MEKPLTSTGTLEPLRQHHLEGVACVDVFPDALDALLRNVARSKVDRTAAGPSACDTSQRSQSAARQRRPQAGLDLGQAGDRGRVGRVEVGLLVAEDVGEQRDGVAQMVEHHDDVGEQEGHVGQAEIVGGRVRQVLHVADAVVAEVAHGAAHEGRQHPPAAAPGS